MLYSLRKIAFGLILNLELDIISSTIDFTWSFTEAGFFPCGRIAQTFFCFTILI